MNTNALKRFATAARQKLMAQVTAKLDYVLGADSPALRERADTLRQLRHVLTTTPRAELIERVAYTWFNRFVALRFLDVNDYQPAGIRAVSAVAGFTTPQLLDEAKNGQIPDELPVDSQRVMDLLNNKLPSRDPQNEAYQLLLTATCNALNGPLPFLFEEINDFTDLLMPDDLLSPQSVLADVREGMSAGECQNVEIIGWLYQFYISERKDAVFAAKSKVKADDIPAATQLFTPRWVVEYMVQNTLGKLWLRNRPGSGLKARMPYYLESPSETTNTYLPITKPQELTLLDPAAGSGHILVYAFELLTHIYEEEGYSPTEIPTLILQHNLMGFDIDGRAAQLALFALTMKARQMDRRFFRRAVQPRVVALYQLNERNEADWQPLLAELELPWTDALRADLADMTQAHNLGSLIQPRTPAADLRRMADAVQTWADRSTDIFRKQTAEDLALALEHLALLAQKHTCVVMNPPYMVDSNMNPQLHSFVNTNYPDTRTDLMACFMERGLKLVKQGGYLAMINQHSWFFLISYEGLRKKLIDNTYIETLLHLGTRTFPEIPGEKVQNTAFTILNNSSEAEGIYVRLVDYKDTETKAKKSTDTNLHSRFRLSDFKDINGLPFAFWSGKQTRDALKTHPLLKSAFKSRQGLATGDNKLFIREWFEVDMSKVGFGFKSKDAAHQSDKDWFPIDNGGGFRKWFGNNNSVIKFNKDAYKVLKTQGNRCPSEDLYFKEGLTWGKISSGSFSVRYSPEGSIFTDAGMKVFVENEDAMSLISFLNSNSVNSFLKCFSETLNFEKGNIDRLPIHPELPNDTLASVSVSISREDWDARETSWDFQTSELLRHRTADGLLVNAVRAYETHWQSRFTQLHQNEESLNRIFIDLYGLQDELTPDVAPDDITILGPEAKPDSAGKLTFDRRELMAQFVSFAVGCMVGRYSLDKPGLMLASQGQTLTDYERLTGVTPTTFQPDTSNIIPIQDEDWFTDDIVAQFQRFLRVAFTNPDVPTGPAADRLYQQNLSFVEEGLGMDLRKWFLKHFYDDHVRRYRRRPIYWLFRSPRGAFSALIYLHRYTPDTVSRLLNGYLREYQDKLRNRREQQKTVTLSESVSAGEKTRAQKDIDRIGNVLEELAQYERDIIFPLATQPLALDLDDGVLVNYNRFGAALAPVKGLTGKAGGREDE